MYEMKKKTIKCMKWKKNHNLNEKLGFHPKKVLQTAKMSNEFNFRTTAFDFLPVDKISEHLFGSMWVHACSIDA